MGVVRDGYTYYTEEELLAKGWKYSDNSVLTRIYVSKDSKFCAFFCEDDTLAPIMENLPYTND